MIYQWKVSRAPLVREYVESRILLSASEKLFLTSIFWEPPLLRSRVGARSATDLANRRLRFTAKLISETSPLLLTYNFCVLPSSLHPLARPSLAQFLQAFLYSAIPSRISSATRTHADRPNLRLTGDVHEYLSGLL